MEDRKDYQGNIEYTIYRNATECFSFISTNIAYVVRLQTLFKSELVLHNSFNYKG